MVVGDVRGRAGTGCVWKRLPRPGSQSEASSGAVVPDGPRRCAPRIAELDRQQLCRMGAISDSPER